MPALGFGTWRTRGRESVEAVEDALRIDDELAGNDALPKNRRIVDIEGPGPGWE